MKKLFFVLAMAALVTVTACSSQGTVADGASDGAVSSENERTSDETGDTAEDGQTTSYEEIVGQTVMQTGPCGTISLTLPDGWTYDMCDPGDDRLVETSYGLQIYPEDASGFVEVGYMAEFSVCGTGLEEEQVTLAGDTANVGYIDGSQVMSFVVFKNSNEGVVAWSNENENWTGEQQETMLAILNTVSFDPDTVGGAMMDSSYADNRAEDLCVVVQPKNIASTGCTLWFYQSDSQAADEITFTEDFTLEKMGKTDFEEVPVTAEGDAAAADVLNTINMENETVYDYNWEGIYGSLDTGDYRIAIHLQAKKADGSAETYTIYAHFMMR